MCEGTITIMSCGHALIHYISYCHQAVLTHELKPCPKEGTHGHLQRIDDTCAKCHPSRMISDINRHHDEFHARKMAQMRQAKTRKEVSALQRMLEEAHAARGEKLRAAGKVRWNGMVLWGPPGANGEMREEYEL